MCLPDQLVEGGTVTVDAFPTLISPLRPNIESTECSVSSLSTSVPSCGLPSGRFPLPSFILVEDVGGTIVLGLLWTKV